MYKLYVMFFIRENYLRTIVFTNEHVGPLFLQASYSSQAFNLKEKQTCMHSYSKTLKYIFALLFIFYPLTTKIHVLLWEKMPAMAAFMDKSFSSTVLEEASRQKYKHDGLEEQPQTISCTS